MAKAKRRTGGKEKSSFRLLPKVPFQPAFRKNSSSPLFYFSSLLLAPLSFHRLLLLSLLLNAYYFSPSYFPPYSLLLITSLLPTFHLTPYYYYFSPSYFSPYSFLLPSLPLTPYYFSPYSFPAFSSNLSTSHCSCWAMVSCPLSSSMASSALRNGLTSR